MSDLAKLQNSHTQERLRSEIMLWLSSVRPDGRPHLVPVWFLWDGETILIFSKPDQKIRNLRQNPNVVVSLDTAEQGDDIVLIEGRAELLNDPNIKPTLPAYAEKYAERLSSMGWTAEIMAKDYSQAIRITPTKFLIGA